MSDIAAFIAARLDEDEAIANRAARKRRGPWRVLGDAARALVHGNRGPDLPVADTPGLMIADHIARHDPARALREVAALRDIVDAYQECLKIQAGFKEVSSEEARRDALEMCCRQIAAIWADHPGYDETWKLGDA